MSRDYLAWAYHDTGRIEVRHQDGGRWHCGLFDDLLRLRQTVDALSGRGNLYISINAPKIITAANEMTGGALQDDDIAFVVRLPIDFDPVRPKGVASTDDELQESVAARNGFVTAMASLGWPTPATGISGNGAHALYRCRLRSGEQTAGMLRALYRGWRQEFSSDVVLFDSTVSNASRIWRLYGTRNRKGEATSERPHRVSSVIIPSRWDAVSPTQIEQLSTAYASRERQSAPQARAGRSMTPRGSGNYATLDISGWFAARGAYKRQIAPGKHAVRCPWVGEHSTEDDARGTDSVVWEADAGRWPSFHCSHAHCESRTIVDVMQVWDDVDNHCAAQWQRSRPS